MNSAHQIIIRKALDFMEDNLGKALSVEMIAREIGYSSSWFRNVFTKATGQGVRPYLAQMRLKRAKHLLRETDLDISEIAFEAGFSSYTYFADTFRAKEGATPSAFRVASRKGMEPIANVTTSEISSEEKEWFADDLKGPATNEAWLPLSGEWQQRISYIEGSGDESLALALTKPLPENFRLTFKSQFPGTPELQPSDLSLELADSGNTRAHYSFVIGAQDNTTGLVRRKGRDRYWNAAALITPGKWQTVSLELHEESFRLELDGETVFSFRDPFPVPYALRCNAVLRSWMSVWRVHDFHVWNLGISPTVRRIREGDSYYDAEIFDRAHDFYMRYLSQSSSAVEEAELRYKIGMCLLQKQSYSQANGWFEKVLPAGATQFWYEQSSLARLETGWRKGDLEEFMEQIKSMGAQKQLIDGVREIAIRASGEQGQRGFVHRAIEIREALLAVEDPLSQPALLNTIQIGDLEKVSNQFAKSAARLEAALQAPEITDELRVAALMELADVACIQGHFDVALRRIDEILAGSQLNAVQARARVYRTFVLRGQGNTEEAIRELDAIPKEFPNTRHMCAFAVLSKSLILCSLGQPQKATEAIQHARTIIASYPYLQKGSQSHYGYVPLLVAGRFREAADGVWQDATIPSSSLAWKAWQSVVAGILYELAGNEKSAKKAWTNASNRFPPARVAFYGELARSLILGRMDRLEEMPYYTSRCSEMAYLVALLYEKRDNPKRCRELLALSLERDPSLRWPAFLAQRRLRDAGS